MRAAESVTFSEVLTVYGKDHPADRSHASNTNADGERNLHRAHALLGSWYRVELGRADILDVVLPWHLGESGRRELVPRTGLTVAQAAEIIRADPDAYARANPVCATKLDRFARAPMTPVYLSTRPVDHADYAGLRTREGLIHLDGLHRMLGWEVAGRLRREASVEVFLADFPRRSHDGATPRGAGEAA
ncbi:DUF6309 family protein [Streptomyces sp. NPDC008125]|uniref:DUF6309 family protein n=1 Tax=Streptomyces sp. NPDC008125 TaxID=3364811 RepID=UPI0036F05B71